MSLKNKECQLSLYISPGNSEDGISNILGSSKVYTFGVLIPLYNGLPEAAETAAFAKSPNKPAFLYFCFLDCLFL